MRIVFNADLCTGHGRCYALAPDVFDADDQGHCVVLCGTSDHLATEHEAGARTGADNCPEGALTISD